MSSSFIYAAQIVIDIDSEITLTTPTNGPWIHPNSEIHRLNPNPNLDNDITVVEEVGCGNCRTISEEALINRLSDLLDPENV